MKKRLLNLLLAFPIFCSAQNTLVIKNVSVIDITDSIVRKNQTVITQGNKIISTSKKDLIPKGATIIDGKGKYLIPGLWDMHVHALDKERLETFLPLFIANGITGVRNMGTTISLEQINLLRDEISKGKIIAPRFFACGPILDGPNPAFRFVVTNETQARRAVDSLKQQGADFIKVYNNLNREIFFAIADECKKLNIPFAGHLPLFIDAREASDAGQKSFEHMGNISGGLLLSCSNEEETIRTQWINAITKPQPSVEETINVFNSTVPKIVNTFDKGKAKQLTAELIKNNTWVCPTFVLLRVFTMSKDSIHNNPQLNYLIPLDKRRQDPQNSPVFKNQDQVMIENYQRLFQGNLDLVKNMHVSGVKFLAGTDAPVFLSMPGFSLHDELELFVQAGFSPLEALKTATINPAKYFNMENQMGTIEKGKIADMVLLDANPLENISNTKKIYAVIVNGKLLERKDLDELLDKAKQLATK
jgi:imidazolonepropionase-like amidohydrolase